MKGRKIKKFLGLILTASLMLGMSHPVGNVQAEDNLLAGTQLLAHYEFNDGGKDSSGNNNHATIGNGVTVSNGVASLPGGTKDGSQYITLPEGMFDKQDTLTISMWLKDNDPRENWLAAFFFGSKNSSNNTPTNYYYFVPCEKQHNTLKLVMTNSVNEGNPSSTEKGFRESDNTESYFGVWTHYAIVIQPSSMKCYINGDYIGTKAVNRKISDFGTGLQAYIGKSNYPNDPLYQGDFKDFRVYKNALSEEQIRQAAGIKEEVSEYSMTIDGNNVTKKLSDNLYGLFFEDINSSADGGLYPEMVKNYSFENAYMQNDGGDYFKQNGYVTVGHYKLHWTASPEDNFDVNSSDTQSTEESLNETNPHYAILTGNVTLQNGGFAPQNNPNGAAMPVKPLNATKKTGTYTFSVFTKASLGYSGTIKVKLVDDSGKALTDEKEISLDADGTWKRVTTELTSKVTSNTKGKLVLSVQGAGSNDKLYLDMVSVVPHDSYGYGNKNYAYGVGVRQDLLDLMMDLDPKFMRFPGGCIVEGFNWEGLYDWRDSIGPLEERKSNTNRWENWNNKNRTWGYMQSYGFGYHELLSLCEDFQMEPFPILSAGVLCQYETKDVDAKTGDELQEFIDMATQLLDYCWGDASKNQWAAKRAQNGHEKPFNLKYLGIGNENAFAKYFDNFDVIKEAVEEYARVNYPGHELHIISSAGPTSNSNPSGDGYFSRSLEYAYDRLAQTVPGETLVDEHYYESESFMYNNVDRYDYYQRINQGGSNVFVGEYAIRNFNKYNTALAEACYITGLERNADVVTNISYAPLLYKVGNLSWDHDMIYFDEFNTAKSTNYYVQKMFSNNYGTDLIGTELEAKGKDYSNYGSPILGMNGAEGYIDKVVVYDKDGKILLEDDFNDNTNGWTSFKGSNSFTISDGYLTFTGNSGINAVYLPKAVQEKWKNFRIEVRGAVKTSGNGGFVAGAGYDNQYYWYTIDGSGARMEVTRPERGGTELKTKMLGNNFANKHYKTEELTAIQTDDFMDIAFNFGIGGKLEASYTSGLVSAANTAKYDFSSVLNQYQTDIYQVVNKDDKNVYIKLVNPDRQRKSIQLNFKNLNVYSKAEVTTLTGGLGEANAIGEEIVVPTTMMQSIQNNTINIPLSGCSVNVIRVPLAQNSTDPKPEPKPEPEPDPQPQKPQPKSVSLNVGKSITIGQGESVTLKATVKPVGASKKVTWTTSKKSNVAVKNGKITGKKPGKSVITVKTTNGKKKTCTVTVKKKPNKITLNAKSKTLKKGKTFRIKVKFPKNTYSYKLTYSSNKKKVATVSTKGIVKAKKKGKAAITVKTFNGKKAKVTITVK